MYSDSIYNDYRYDLNEAKFQTAVEFINRKDLTEIPVGLTVLENGVTASVQEYTTMAPAELPFETHDKFLDLQYVVKGEEIIQVVPREILETKTVYDADKDIEFYKEPNVTGGVYLKAGHYTILSPNDAHKPRCIAEKPEFVKKIVLKIPV